MSRILTIPSPSGKEAEMKRLIAEEMEREADLTFQDSFGNLIFTIKAAEKTEEADKIRLCVECGIDEPFLITTEGERGKIRYTAPPHIKAADFAGRSVLLEGKEILIESGREEAEKSRVSDLFSVGEAEFGLYVTLLPEFKEEEERIFARNIGYKAPAAALQGVLKNIKAVKPDNVELTFVFSVQRCLGARGVLALKASGLYFDEVISAAALESEEEGVHIMAIEKSCVLSPEIRDRLRAAAEKKTIPYKMGFTDKGYFMRHYLSEGYPCPCGLLCLPVKDNSVKKEDIKSAEELIIEYIKQR